jgi:anti-sigma regulatory factor (Ser/Thr protein kinase)
MASEITILVPNILTEILKAERFYISVEQAPSAERYVFDMGDVTFVKPYGVIVLLSAARQLADLSGHSVRMKNFDEDVYAYLERIDLFEIGGSWLQPADALNKRWSRNPKTVNLLELTLISNPEDATTVAIQARRIFSDWLDTKELNSLITVLSEVCANIYQHSEDSQGYALIQKYEAERRGQVIVQVAVGDRGCGIRWSLAKRHHNIGEDPLDYLKAAMQGLSARNTGRGGLGLRHVEQIVASKRGYLWLRSETAALMTRGPKRTRSHKDLTYVKGTQVAVELRASQT